MSEIILRDYQQAGLDKTMERFESGIQRQCWVWATGAGKTLAFCHIPRIKPGRTFFLTHREELADQIESTLRLVNPDISPIQPIVEMGDRYADDYADNIVMSVPTLGRENSKRLSRFLKPDNLIIDEAHHCIGESWKNVIESFGFPYDGSLSSPKGSLLLCVTATPKRTDNIGLDHVAQEVTSVRSMRDQIEEGYAVDFLPYRIISNTSLEGISIRAGDFAENELAQRVDNDERNHLAVNAYIQHALGKQALFFCSNIKHVNAVTLLFQRSGIKAESVDGNTPKLTRAAIFNRYKNKQTQVIVNCGVATEGTDLPMTECIGMLRPTKSQLLYIQIIGRGSRTIEDLRYCISSGERLEKIAKSKKPNCIILDIVDICSKHTPIMAPVLWGLNKDLDTRGECIFKVLKKIEEAKAKTPGLRIEDVCDVGQLQAMSAKALKINIWEAGELSHDVKKYSKFTWQQRGDESYFISLNRGQSMQIKEDTLGHFEASIETVSVQNSETMEWEPVTPSVEVLGHSATIEEVFHRSDKYITEEYSELIPLVDQKAKWRDDQASVAQFEKLKKWRVPVFEKEGKYLYLNPMTGEKEFLSKGYAGALMGKKLEEFKRRNR